MDDLKDIRQSTKSQPPNVTYCELPFIWHPQKDKTLVMKKIDECLSGIMGVERVWL